MVSKFIPFFHADYVFVFWGLCKADIARRSLNIEVAINLLDRAIGNLEIQQAGIESTSQDTDISDLKPEEIESAKKPNETNRLKSWQIRYLRAASYSFRAWTNRLYGLIREAESDYRNALNEMENSPHALYQVKKRGVYCFNSKYSLDMIVLHKLNVILSRSLVVLFVCFFKRGVSKDK